MRNAMWLNPTACLRPRNLPNVSVPTLAVLMSHLSLFPKRLRDSALSEAECTVSGGYAKKPQVGFELRGSLKVSNVANTGNDGRSEDGADARDRGQNSPLTGVFDNLCDLDFYLFQVTLEQL